MTPYYERLETIAGVVGLAAVLSVLACGVPEPDPASVRLARLAANTAADAIDDLGAVIDPDGAGVRDAFRAAALAALQHAREAHETAPETTADAYAKSLDAADLSDRLGDALSVALESRAALDAGVLDAHAKSKAADAADRAGEADRTAQEAERYARYDAYRGDSELGAGHALTIEELEANLGLGDVDPQQEAAHAAAAEARRSAFAKLEAERSADLARFRGAITKLEGLMEAADSAWRADAPGWFDVTAQNRARRVALLAAREAVDAELEAMKAEHAAAEVALLEYALLFETSRRNPDDREAFLAAARDTLGKHREATLASRQVVVSARKVARVTILAFVEAVGGSSGAVGRAVRTGDAEGAGSAIHTVRAEAVRNAIDEALQVELKLTSEFLSTRAREAAEAAAKASREAEQAEMEALHAVEVVAADIDAAERLRVEAIGAYRRASAAWLALQDSR